MESAPYCEDGLAKEPLNKNPFWDNNEKACCSTDAHAKVCPILYSSSPLQIQQFQVACFGLLGLSRNSAIYWEQTYERSNGSDFKRAEQNELQENHTVLHQLS